MYQLGKDAIGKLCTINLFSACDHYAVSVIDNLLAVHNTDSRISMIFDVWLQQWTNHPIAAPLPLVIPPPALSRSPPRRASSGSGNCDAEGAVEQKVLWVRGRTE